MRHKLAINQYRRPSLLSGKLVVSVALVAGLLVLASGAYADTISIGLQEAGVNGGSITQVAVGAGFASYAGVYGDFSFNSITGTGSPNVPEPALYSSSFNAQANGVIGSVLNVFVTEQGLTSPTGINSFVSSFTSQLFSGAITSVQEQTFIDTANGLYGGTLLASSTFFGAGNNSSVNSTPSLGSSYSETVEYTVTAFGQGQVNDTIDINAATPVAEPSSLLLSGLGIGGLLLLAAKRRISIA